jgi:hypothetical protein
LRKLRDTHGAVDLARWVLAELHAAQQAALPPPPPPPPPPAPPKPEDKPEDKDGQSDDTDGDQDGQDDGQDDGQGDDTDGDQDGQDDGQDDGQGDDTDGDQDDDTDGQDDGQGDDTDGDQDDDTDGQDDGQGDDTDGQGDDGQGDDTDGQGDDGQKSTTWAASDGAGGLDPASTMQAMMDELKAREGVQADQAAQSVVMAWTGCESTPAPQPSPARGAALRSLMPAPAVLRDQITRLIRSDERHGTERYRSSGRLDRRALTRAARDGTNVFARRTFAPGVDTAILFLIDGSSSMSKGVFDPQTGTIMQHNGMRVSRMNLAQFLAQHLAEAADAARGKVCVCVFHGTENLGSLQEVKTFDRPLEVDVLATTSSYGYTPLSVSILGGAERLMNEQATRRILMVLTDGECDLGAERVKAAVKMTEARGVETVGIGCGTDVAYAFERFVNVMDMSRLAEDGLAALVDLLQPDDEAA